MSYRTYVNGTQIFGNNEYYPEWIEFVKSCGIEVNEEGYYDGEITDFMGALNVIEKIALKEDENIRNRNNSLRSKNYEELSGRKLHDAFDLTSIPEEINSQDENDKYRVSLLDRLFEVVENYYAFLPYTFYKICKELIERDKLGSYDGHLNCFKVKEGMTIKVSAH